LLTFKCNCFIHDSVYEVSLKKVYKNLCKKLLRYKLTEMQKVVCWLPIMF